MKSYNDIVKSCQLFDYQEINLWRIESWVGEEGIWDCYWFYSNNSHLPNTYKLKVI